MADEEEMEQVLTIILVSVYLIWMQKRRLQYAVHRYKPSTPYAIFNWSPEDWPTERLRRTCRFTLEEINILVPLLGLDQITWSHRYEVDPRFALCYLCAKLANPSTLFQA